MKQSIDFFKKYPGLTLFSIVLILLDIYQQNFSLTIFVVYVWVISLLFPGIIEPNFIKGGIRELLKKVIWALFAVCILLSIYVNYLPHGPMINTGYDCVDTNDGRTTECGDQYVEDMRNLNIPGWAKFLREAGFVLLLALFIAGTAVSQKDELK